MNNKNVYSLNNAFEGKIWVDWKGKDGKMGQEISWREKHFYSAEIPTHWHLCEVYLTVPVPVPVPACTRVKDYGRVPCAVSQISGCGRPQIIHTSMEIAAFSGMSTRVCILRALFMSTENIGSDIGRCSKKNIGHRIGRQNWHRLILICNVQPITRQYTIYSIRTQVKYKVYRARDLKDTQSTWEKNEQETRTN